MRKKLITNSDKIALAIILVENQLRPLIWRYLEYIYMSLLSIFQSEKIFNVSIGLGQLKYRYWKEYYTIYSYSILDIRVYENVEINFELVKWYLCNYKIENFGDISLCYTGKRNKYYELLIRGKISKINSVCK